MPDFARQGNDFFKPAEKSSSRRARWPQHFRNVFGRNRPVSDGGGKAQTNRATNVSDRINTGERSSLRAIRNDVTRLVERELPLQKPGVRLNAQTHEEAADLAFLLGSGQAMGDGQPQRPTRLLIKFGDLAVCQHVNARMLENGLLPAWARPKLVGTMHQRHARANCGENQTILKRRIAAAHDADFLPGKELLIARGRMADAAPNKFFFAKQAQPPIARAGRNNERLRRHRFPVHNEATLPQVDFIEAALQTIRQIVCLQMRGKGVAQFGAGSVREARIFQHGMNHLQHLPAEFRRLFEQHRPQAERMTPQQRTDARRAAAEDDDLRIHRVIVLAPQAFTNHCLNRRRNDAIITAMLKWFCLLVIVAGLFTSCSLSQAQKKDARFKPWTEVSGAEASSEYADAKQLGTITDKSLAEISGLTASRVMPGVFWVHNDSGDKARLYAIDAKGKLLAKVDVTGAKNEDWEDIASGPGADGKPALYLADTGNNEHDRTDLTIYRVREPKLGSEKKAATEAAEAFPFSYPDGNHDCEAIFVDPTSGQIYLVTKTLKNDCAVYRFPLPLKARQKVVLEKVSGAKIKSLTQLRMVTGAAVAPDGSRVAIRTYFGAFELQRTKGKAFSTIFDHEPAVLKVPLMGQAEAIAYSADSKSLLLTSERLPAPLYQMTRK